LTAGQKDWEDISNLCRCRQFRTDSQQETGLVNTRTLNELIRLLIKRVEVKENTTGAARYNLQHSCKTCVAPE